jgi:anti-anti-sigma factor
MAIQYKKNKNEIIVYIIGELDYDHGEKLYEFIEQNRSLYNNVIINLERVNYINFEGLERLVDIYNIMRDKKFLIEKAQGNIKEILKKIGLLMLLPVGK